jgi:hypothetical protein
MRAPKRKTIAGRVYQVVPLPTGQGLALLVLITKHMARGLENVPSLAALAAHAGSALADVLTNLDEANVARLVRELTEGTMVEPTPEGTGAKLVPLAGISEDLYAGNFAELAQFVAFGLEVNYGSFLGVIKAATAKAPAAAPAASGAAST